MDLAQREAGSLCEILVRDLHYRGRRSPSFNRRICRELSKLGYGVLGDGTPIVPVVSGDPRETMALSAALFDAGIFAHGIRPPTVPVGTSRIRLVPIASHTDAQIGRVISAFAQLAQTTDLRASP